MTDPKPSCEFVDRHTVRMTRDLPHSLERVWAALTDPDELARWFIGPARIDPQAGGAYRFGLHFAGTVQAIDPPRMIELDWWRFELEPTPGGCRLIFTAWVAPGFGYGAEAGDPAGWDQPFGPGTWSPGTLVGWHGFLDCLSHALSEPGRYFGWPPVEGAEFDDPKATAALVGAYRDHIKASTVLAESEGEEPAPPPPRGQGHILRQLVAGLSDGEIADLALEFGGYRALCHLLIRGLQDDVASMGIASGDLDIRVAFRFADDLAWTLTVADGTSTLALGVEPDNRALLETAPADFVRLMAGELSLPDAIANGRVLLSGDDQEAERLFVLGARFSDPPLIAP